MHISPEIVTQLFFDGQQFRQARIRGCSMCPVLPDGAVVTVIADTGPPVPGRIYVYYRHTELIAHRYVMRDRGHLVFWGDRNRNPERASLKSLVGVCAVDEYPIVRFVIRGINRIFINVRPEIFRAARMRIIRHLPRRIHAEAVC